MLQLTSIPAVALFCTAVLAVVGFMLTRAVKAVDTSVAKLSTKVDGLTNQDTKILIEIEGLRARVTALEYLVQGPPRFHKDPP